MLSNRLPLTYWLHRLCSHLRRGGFSVLSSVLVVASLTLSASLAAGTAHAQHTLSADGVVFRANLPSSLSPDRTTYEHTLGTARVSKWEGRQSGCCKVLAFVATATSVFGSESLPGYIPESVKSKMLDVARKKRLESLGGYISSNRTVRVGDHTAHDVTYVVDQGTRAIRSRIVILSNKIVGVEAHGPVRRIEDPYVSRLLQSFQLERTSN